MKKFRELIKNIETSLIYPFEDYSNSLKKHKNGYYEYIGCDNHCIIMEDSLSRLFTLMQTKDFAIISAYRKTFTKYENIQRNRILRAKFNNKKMGVHQLVGHWQEAPTGKSYQDCKKNELTDVVERSYVVFRKSDMSFESFKKLIIDSLTIDNETQDAAIIKNSTGVYLLFSNGNMELIGTKCTLGVIAQAYSQHVKNSLPFVFNGLEEPAGNAAAMLYTKNNILF